MSDESYKPAVMNSLSQEVETRTESAIDMVEQYITEDGLVPEVGERSKGEVYDSEKERWVRYDAETMGGVEAQFGFNTELLGYSMRLAVESGNRELFDRLQKSLDELKTPEGLLKARLHPDRTQDMEFGSSWADANQDVALALIEAGESWELPEYTEKGVVLAETFAQSNHIKRIGNGTVLVFNTPEMANSTTLGDRIMAIDLSMLNIKLYNSSSWFFSLSLPAVGNSR